MESLPVLSRRLNMTQRFSETKIELLFMDRHRFSEVVSYVDLC
jgi:hypothetical protein